MLKRVSPGFLMSPARENELARKGVKQFDVRPPRLELAVGALSGGNQQKVVLAKEVLGRAAPALARRADPRRRRRRQGRDLCAHPRSREQGLGVLIASSEMPELLGLCDRLVVLRGGRSVAEFGPDVTEHEVLAVAEAGDSEAA